ncbi:MAG: dethiobiotin synthase [Candidatus Hydrogenedentes bacterium]|nr:dethiobiotin synthase [Candidatus Hydrogenedentota bacterium]
MQNGLFITGTSTDVGKTIVTAGILRYLRQQGQDIVPMKPVQTGATQVAGEWRAPDLEVHLKAAGLSVGPEERPWMSPYCYEPACSPHLAGRMADRYLSIDHCVECAMELGARHQGVLIEGAGGLLVPLNEDETQLSLIISLEVPVLIVAHIGLGTVNHCLLTIEALRSAEVPIAGVVFNAPTPGAGDDFIGRDNPKAVAQFGGVDVLGNLPYFDGLDTNPDGAWAAFKEHMPGLETIQSYFETGC